MTNKGNTMRTPLNKNLSALLDEQDRLKSVIEDEIAFLFDIGMLDRLYTMNGLQTRIFRIIDRVSKIEMPADGNSRVAQKIKNRIEKLYHLAGKGTSFIEFAKEDEAQAFAEILRKELDALEAEK